MSHPRHEGVGENKPNLEPIMNLGIQNCYKLLHLASMNASFSFKISNTWAFAVVFLTSGAPNLVNLSLWCELCKPWDQHRSEDYYLLQKYIHTLKHLFCNFCRSIGHDEKNCQSYELMMDRTADSYRLQAKGHTHEEKGQHAGQG